MGAPVPAQETAALVPGADAAGAATPLILGAVARSAAIPRCLTIARSSSVTTGAAEAGLDAGEAGLGQRPHSLPMQLKRAREG